MFEFVIDAQPQKGIWRLNDFIKIPFYIMNLFGKRLKIFKIDRIIKTIGMIIKT